MTEAEQDRQDALRYRWLRDQVPCQLYLTRNEHAASYSTVKQEIEQSPENYADVPPETLQAMKDADVDWALQIYPVTPIGFFVWHGATLDAVVDEARTAFLSRIPPDAP